MKTKIILTLCAVLIAAAGCSDSGTTAPEFAKQTLLQPGNSDLNRFNDNIEIAGAKGPESGFRVLRGVFLSDPGGCLSLHLDKTNYVELRFVYEPPRDLRSGMVVEVSGRFSSIPGGHCQYSRLFIIDQITIVSDRLGFVKPIQPNQQ